MSTKKRTTIALTASGLAHAALLAVGLLVSSGHPVLDPKAPQAVTMEFEQAAPGAPVPPSAPSPVEPTAAPPASDAEPVQEPHDPAPASAQTVPPPSPEPIPRPPEPIADLPLENAQPQRIAQEPSPPPRRLPAPERPKQHARPPPAQAEPARDGAPSAAASIAGPAAPAAAPSLAAVQLADGWGAAIAAWLAAHKSYPADARRRGEEGTVGVRFTVEADGRVTDIDITQPSGSAALDQATRALLAGARVPAPRVTVTRTVRLRYRLEE